MPTVNTLVVERSDLLGLGQMHQLRGRVGRSGQRAYAYLFHPVDATLTEEAYERLRTIGEATELGSGFKIAMRDLEIRGAGNLLGEAQSRPHRRGRLRPLLPDGHRGRRRDEGRADPRRRPRSSSTSRPTRSCRPTTWPRRSCGSRRTAGWPAVTTAGRGRRHPRRVGGPLRPAAGGRRGAADRRLPARRVPPARHHRHRRSRPTRPAWRRSSSSSARRCACGASPATRSTRRTPASWSCRSRDGTDPAEFLVGFLRELVPRRRERARVRRRSRPVASAP